MKKNSFLMAFMLALNFSGNVYGQLWKQYADSGNVYSNKKNTVKAIEFYGKAKELLSKDSIGTKTYAGICDCLGFAFLLQREYTEAERICMEAKQTWEKLAGKENLNYASYSNHLASTYVSEGQYKKAEPLLLEIKEIREKLLGKEQPDYLNTTNNLAWLYHKMQRDSMAAPLYLEVKQTNEKRVGKEHLDYVTACYNLANFYREIGNFDYAEPLYLEITQLREKLQGKQHVDYIRSLNNLANIYNVTKQNAKAETLYIEIMKINETRLGKEHPEYAINCYNLGTVYRDEGQNEKAVQFYLEAIKIQEKMQEKSIDYARTCVNLGSVYLTMEQFKKAETFFLIGKQERERILGKDHIDYMLSCYNLGNLYLSTDENDLAEAYYLEAKQLIEKKYGKENSSYLNCCKNLGGLYIKMTLFKNAESLLLEGMQVWEKLYGKNDLEYAGYCASISVLYKDISQFDKAETFALEAIAIFEKLVGKEDLLYARSCNNLAAIYDDMGQHAKAEPFLLEAMRIKEKNSGRESISFAMTCNNLASCYQGMEQYDKAAPLFIESRNTMEKTLGRNNLQYGKYCYTLARFYWLTHKTAEAEKEYKKSFAVNEYNVNSVFQFTNEREKTEFIKDILAENDDAYSFYLSTKIQSEQPYMLSLLHRNLILSASQDLQKKIFYSNDTVLIDKYNQWKDLKNNLSVLYSTAIAERKEDPAVLEEKAEQMEKELTRLSTMFKKQQQKTGWKDIQNKLKPAEAAIEFVEFRYNKAGRSSTDSFYYIALILRKDKPLPALVRLFEKKQLDSLLSNTGNKTTNDAVTKLYASRGIITKGNNTAVNKSVYSLVWKPLETALNGIKTVYFAPAGLLHRIAFAALPFNKNEVLSDKYKLVQLASTASVTDQIPAFINTADNLQLYGGINYDADSAALKQSVQLYAGNIQKENTRSLPVSITRSGTFTYLEGTSSEIKTIEAKAKNSQTHTLALSGINATEESFKSLNGKASPTVIHIATHGFFFPDPKTEKGKNDQTTGNVFTQSDNSLFRSGLLFAGANNAWQGKPINGMEDGILTAYEVSNMYLPNTKLAVLSACETALGDIQGSEGVYGLQRAFKIAGVQNLVMSLWKVPDAETAEFMQLFYKNMFDKQSISDAFYNAQTRMKNKYRNDPYKWAAWVLVR